VAAPEDRTAGPACAAQAAPGNPDSAGWVALLVGHVEYDIGDHGVGADLRPSADRSSAGSGRRLPDAMPYPENLDHHFVVDPTKCDFYAMDCYRMLADTRLWPAACRVLLTRK
jgi:hypothetical protein